MNTRTIESAVVLDKVEKHFPHFVLKQLTLELPKGEVLGLVGPNGAGKSTCLQLLMGFILADSGSIQVLGKSVPEHSVELKQDVAFVAESMRLYGKATLAWHIEFLKKLFPRWDDVYAQHLIKTFELNQYQPIRQFSLGQRVKSTLMLALARKPKLLVLDEPSTGLDPIARNELTEQLFQVMLNEENSVLFSSQFTQDVERLSDSIAFLDGGTLINHQDKESYLDRWRRIRVRGPATSISMPNTVDVRSQHHDHSFIHTDFSDRVIVELQDKGFRIEQVIPMTLEEIFIYQVRHHRQSLGDRKNV